MYRWSSSCELDDTINGVNVSRKDKCWMESWRYVQVMTSRNKEESTKQMAKLRSVSLQKKLWGGPWSHMNGTFQSNDGH